MFNEKENDFFYSGKRKKGQICVEFDARIYISLS